MLLKQQIIKYTLQFQKALLLLDIIVLLLILICCIESQYSCIWPIFCCDILQLYLHIYAYKFINKYWRFILLSQKSVAMQHIAKYMSMKFSLQKISRIVTKDVILLRIWNKMVNISSNNASSHWKRSLLSISSNCIWNIRIQHCDW